MKSRRSIKSGAVFAVMFGIAAGFVVLSAFANPSFSAQENDRLTPLQRKIEHEKQRLSSSEIEERRDALMKLGALKHPDASRVAAVALNDPVPIIRVTAAHAVLSLPSSEAATFLIPLLKDKLEFVRREAAYALGETRSRSAVGPLTEILAVDKEAAVRAAAAIALGQIRDDSAVPALSKVLTETRPKKKSKAGEDEFLMRAAARALGEIRSRAGVEVLIATLANDTNPSDVRREAARALGLIGDSSATPALQAAFASSDPYLAESAREALRRLRSGRN